MLVTLLLLLASDPPAPRVYVETSSLSAGLSAALALELPPEALVHTASAAELLARLDHAGEGLRLVVRRADGSAVLERDLEVQSGLEPALRVAVLLVRRASVLSREVEPPPSAVQQAPRAPAPRPAVEPRSVWRLVPSFSLSTRSGPFSASTGVGAAVELSFGWDVSLGARWLGMPCCVRASPELRADLTEIQVEAQVARVLLAHGPLALGAFGGLGLNFVRGQAKALIYAGEAAVGEIRLVETLVQVGVRGDLSVLEHLALRLALGARISLDPTEISLPAGYSPSAAPLSDGVVAPLAALGLVVSL